MSHREERKPAISGYGQLPREDSLVTVDEEPIAGYTTQRSGGSLPATPGYGVIPSLSQAQLATFASEQPTTGQMYGSLPPIGDPAGYSSLPITSNDATGYGALPSGSGYGGVAEQQTSSISGSGYGAVPERWTVMRDGDGTVFYQSSTGARSATMPSEIANKTQAGYQHISAVRGPPTPVPRPTQILPARPNSAALATAAAAAAPNTSTTSAAVVAAPVSPRRDAASPYQQVVSARARDEETSERPRGIRHQGWLTKKNQRRYFVLRDSMLFWFQKVVSQSADVMTDVRNYLDLTGCLVRRIPHATPLFELSIEPPAHAHLKTYVLRADSEAELLAWLAVLQGASAPRAVVASTWARANKRRAFVVLDSQLRIFNDDERKDLRACVDVEDVQTLSATSINVVAGAQRIELVFGDAHECEDWQAKLTEAVLKSKWRLSVMIRKQDKSPNASPVKPSTPLGTSSATASAAPTSGRAAALSAPVAVSSSATTAAAGVLVSPRTASATVSTPAPAAVRAPAPPPTAAASAGALAGAALSPRASNVPADEPMRFFGNVSPEAAFDMLRGRRVGTYLIRLSSRPGCLVISWVQSDDVIVHTLVSPTAPSGYVLEGDARKYATIADVVAAYSMSYKCNAVRARVCAVDARFADLFAPAASNA